MLLQIIAITITIIVINNDDKYLYELLIIINN